MILTTFGQVRNASVFGWRNKSVGPEYLMEKAPNFSINHPNMRPRNFKIILLSRVNVFLSRFGNFSAIFSTNAGFSKLHYFSNLGVFKVFKYIKIDILIPVLNFAP